MGRAAAPAGTGEMGARGCALPIAAAPRRESVTRRESVGHSSVRKRGEKVLTIYPKEHLPVPELVIPFIVSGKQQKRVLVAISQDDNQL